MPVAIVAIPTADDRVWKISSQKVPHLTLCILGELTSDFPVEHITTYLAHVARTSMTRFGLSVDHRGTLGENQADVLFFRKDFMTDNLEDVRHFLLEDPKIRAAYDSVEQFPEWVPHLTLGFPESPAKVDTSDFPGIHWVDFDRVALWTGDFEGPEFRLDDNDWGSVRMNELVEEFLEHHGIKGMRWGVRRTRQQLDADAPEHVSAQLVKAKGKRSGTRALTNKEIQDYVTRLNLERQYKQTTPGGKASAFITKLLIGAGSQQAQTATNTAAAKLVASGISRAKRS